ncbi:PAS domain S-box protein [Paenibacillus senegalensis]|uniref:PAS domain S-box protein n=1 Tax=Paenibacillus senegalensis TaxID=1465766 RepID=UPI00028A11B6|nr:PAS domain S-box protein [Paenibacillus senegalensis]
MSGAPVTREDQRYLSLVEHNPAAIWSVDLEGNIESANPAAEQMSGYDQLELVSLNLFELIPEVEAQKLRERFNACLTGSPTSFELQFRKKDGAIIDLGAKLVPIVEHSAATGIFFIARDITDRKQSETELIQTKEQMESLFNNTSDAIVIFDQGYRVTRVNRAFEKLYGWKAEEIMGSVIPIVPEDRMEELKEACREMAAAGAISWPETVMRTKEGMLVEVSVSLSPISNCNGEYVAYAAFSKDTSERNAMEKALRLSEARYRLIAENMSDLIAVYDRKGDLVFSTPSYNYLLNYTSKGDNQARLDSLVDSKDKEKLWETFQFILESKRSARFEYRYHSPGSQPLFFEASGIPVVNDQDEVESVIIVSRDITSRKKTEAALQEAEAKYRSLVEEALVGVYLIQEWRLTYVNPRCEEMLGYAKAELMNKHVLDLVHPEDYKKLIRMIKKRKGRSIHFLFRAIHKEGRTIDLELHGALTTYKEKPAIIGTVIDITERKKTEELIHRSDKLSVVGQLAAGVAHEIRNPLTSLKGFVQLMRAKNQDTQYLDIMLSELDRINYIVSEFMVIAKPQAIQFQMKDLRKIFQDVIPLLDTQAILSNIQIKLYIQGEVPLIHCDENQLKQVFINVLKNAIESMPEGGIIRIKIRETGSREVQITVIDQGSGISPERLARLGEPFYTTKEKGTGLGLMVCYKIIEMHHGTMKIKSRLQEGTTVTITLPVKERLEEKEPGKGLV